MREGFKDMREGKALVKRNNEEQWRKEEKDWWQKEEGLEARVRKEGGKRGTKELTRAGEGAEHENKSAD